MDEGKLTEFSLKNGLQCVLYDMPGRNSVSIGVWVRMGGRYEPQKYKGIAHFIEHMLFKGSKKYSCRQIKEELEGVGASLNGFTSQENTCYLVKISKEHALKGLDVLSDMVLNPVLDEAELEKERMVIMEEIRMYMDLPQHYVVELAEELLWEGHILGKPLAGTFKTVSNISRDVMYQFHKKYYRPKNIVVVAAGAIPEGFKEAVEEAFSDYEPGRRSTFKPFDVKKKSPSMNLFKKKTEQAHLCMAYQAPHRTHPMRYPASVLNVITGGNMSSRLFDEVREKRGLAYHVSSSYARLSDTGAFFIKAGTDNLKADKTIALIVKELNSMSNGKITKKEFERAKEFLLGQITLSLEDSMEVMLFLGERKTTNGTIELPDKVRKAIKKVSLESVKKVAMSIFNKRNMNLALISPLTDGQEKAIRGLGR